MKIKIRYPSSFSTLLVGGFVLVTLPLLGGMLNIAYRLDTMAQEGRQSVTFTADITTATRQLREAVLGLQRAAGQYYVLEDPALKGTLHNAHRQFLTPLTDLLAMHLDSEQARLLDSIATQETTLYDRLRQQHTTGIRSFESFKPDFERLHAAVATLVDSGNLVIQYQSTALGRAADKTQRIMFWQALASIPLSLMLAGLFSLLVTRPMRQLTQSIRKLGEDDLETPVTIDGPQDMVYLGERLDWLRRQLIELEEKKQRFFRHASHELKTPLASLHEAIALLADGIPGDLTPDQREIIAIMQTSSRDLQHRIEDMLRYKQAIRQSEQSTRSHISLEQLLTTVTERFELPLRAKHAQLSVSAAGLHLYGDRDKWETVFENLIGNALRFRPEGGIVKISVERHAEQIQIQVCDQGPGVHPEDRRHIFQPFYQGANQPKDTTHGSGLGLAIARAYVETQGGQLTLVHLREWGACFQISIALPEERARDVS
ncbi:MAG: HAMP domain-containing histidine kinase [Gammaproteobacteria bacterium]|nr:HAMP domain-containing histidine kinase [Gammaproteobacteria bacterium]